jgi:hypothetical protein
LVLDYEDEIPEDFIIYKILKKNFIVELDKDPDYLIFSDYFFVFLNYDCGSIHYSIDLKVPVFYLM